MTNKEGKKTEVKLKLKCPRKPITNDNMNLLNNYISDTFFHQSFNGKSLSRLSLLFQRHFSVFAVHFPSADALATIFSSILSAHFLQGGFSYGVSRSVGTLIQVHSQHKSAIQPDFSLCLSIYQSFSP